jgi:asparagine synthase (glutamine-hydrolysing)
MEVMRYWRAPMFAALADKGNVPGELELIQNMEMLLQDSVKRQLVADVPVGILLSGGVDSSLVTAMAARHVSSVKTFTMRFQGHGSYDETEHARLVARHFGTEHLEMDAGTVSPDLLPQLAHDVDEPIADSSLLPTFLVTRLTRQHCTVALGGDGGDELFGGYRHYTRLLKFHRAFGWAPRVLRAPIAAAARAVLPIGFKGRNWLQGFDADFEFELPWVATHFDREARREVLSKDRSWAFGSESIRLNDMMHCHDLLERATRDDLEFYLVEDILAKVDRTSMLNSLEVRAPLLDYRIVEFAFSKVPSYLKATAAETKILLKKLAARVLPAEFDVRRKQGFSVPLDSWLGKKEWRQFFSDVLSQADGTIFERSALQRLMQGQAKGRANGERLFAIVLFEVWRRNVNAYV